MNSDSGSKAHMPEVQTSAVDLSTLPATSIDQPASTMSRTEAETHRTRSGRPITRRADTPNDDFVEASPKKKRSKAAKPRAANPHLPGPLSIVTRDLNVPVRDMQAWVHRSLEDRRAEVARKKGYVTRPMNSFMLYRSAYAERTKVWCTANNHQVVSSVSGASWPMEPQSVRDHYNELSLIERDEHARAFPDYKFQPAKPGQKRGHTQETESDGGNASDPDGDWADSHGIRKRRTRQTTRERSASEHRYAPSPTLSQLETIGNGPYGYHAVQPIGAPIAMPHQMYSDMQQQWLHYQMVPPSHPYMYADNHGLPYHPSQFLPRHGVHGLATLAEENDGCVGLPGGSFHELSRYPLEIDPLETFDQAVIDPTLTRSKFDVTLPGSAAGTSAPVSAKSQPEGFLEPSKATSTAQQQQDDELDARWKERTHDTSWDVASDYDPFWTEAAKLNDAAFWKAERKTSDARSLRSRNGSKSDRSVRDEAKLR